LEPVDRFTLAVRKRAYKWAIKLVAQINKAVIPKPVRNGFQDAISNMTD
jgi:ABC-type transporter lipoprotein component MlaA